MPLGTKVGLGPCHTVLHEDPAPREKGPQFSARVYCGQTVAHLSYTAEHLLIFGLEMECFHTSDAQINSGTGVHSEVLFPFLLFPSSTLLSPSLAIPSRPSSPYFP